LDVPKKKGHTLLRLSQMVRSRIDKVHAEQGKRTYDETLTILLDEHETQQQLLALLSPLYKELGTDSPVEALRSILETSSKSRETKIWGENWKTSLSDVENLLSDASTESDKPVEYLRKLLAAKRDFKKVPEQRQQGFRGGRKRWCPLWFIFWMVMQRWIGLLCA
jgi:hypothetical protein